MKLLTFLVGKISSNIVQYSMVLYAANPDIIISPPVVIALGSVAFFFNGMDVIIDLFISRERKLAANITEAEDITLGMFQIYQVLKVEQVRQQIKATDWALAEWVVISIFD